MRPDPEYSLECDDRVPIDEKAARQKPDKNFFN